jgi:hypothetical protein
MGLHKYAIIMPTEKERIHFVITVKYFTKYNFVKKNFYTVWFSFYPNITSKLRTVGMFKSSVKANMIQIKLRGMSMMF